MSGSRVRLPGRLIVPALSVAQLISWGAMYYGFAVILDPMSAELGLSRTRLSAGYSLGLLVAGLAAWPVGMLIDRGRARAVMTAGSLLAGLGLALHATVQTDWQLYAVWLLLGFAMAGTLYEPAFAMLIRAYPLDYRRRITVLTLLGGLASTVFWPLSAWLVAHDGWRSALLVMAGLQLVVCAPLHWFGVPPDALPAPGGASSPAGSAAAAAAPAGVGTALRSPVFLLLIGSFSANVLVMASVAAHLLGMLERQGLPKVDALLVASCIGPMQVLGRLALFALEGRVRGGAMTRAIVWLLPLSLITLLLLALPLGAVALAVALAGAVLWGTGNGMMTIVKGTAVADLIGAAQVATLNGIAAVPSAFMRASGPFLIAWIWDSTGSVPAALTVMAGVSTISAWLMLAALRQGRVAPFPNRRSS
jgi:MFS family permease